MPFTSSTTEDRVFLPPLNLPAEVFDIVLANLPFADLWQARATSSSWSTAINQSPSLWTDLDFSAFKAGGRHQMILKCVELAKGRTKSLKHDHGRMPIKPDAYSLRRDIVRATISRCPLLEIVELRGTFLGLDVLVDLPSPQLLTSLDIEVSGASSPVYLTEQLAQLNGLKSLVIKEGPTTIFDRTWPVWPPPGSLSNLKHLRLIAPLKSSRVMSQTFRGLDTTVMALAMPNLETLHTVGYMKLDFEGHQDTCDWPDFRGLAKLKKVVFRHRTWVGPLHLPPSIEHLDMEVMRPASFHIKLNGVDLFLPNLKVLHFNVEPVLEGSTRKIYYFWAELLKRSGCRLRELRIGDAHTLVPGPGIAQPDELDKFGNQYQGQWILNSLFAMGSCSIGSLLRKVRVLQMVLPKACWCLNRDMLDAILEDCPKLEMLVWNGHYHMSSEEENELLDPISKAGRRLRFEISCTSWTSVYPPEEESPEDRRIWRMGAKTECDCGTIGERLCFETPGVYKHGKLVYH